MKSKKNIMVRVRVRMFTLQIIALSGKNIITFPSFETMVQSYFVYLKGSGKYHIYFLLFYLIILMLVKY